MSGEILTEEDRRNIAVLARELPTIRRLLEELVETLDILSDRDLMRSIELSGEDVERGRLLEFGELLRELNIDEEEI